MGGSDVCHVFRHLPSHWCHEQNYGISFSDKDISKRNWLVLCQRCLIGLPRPKQDNCSVLGAVVHVHQSSWGILWGFPNFQTIHRKSHRPLNACSSYFLHSKIEIQDDKKRNSNDYLTNQMMVPLGSTDLTQQNDKRKILAKWPQM